jgi:gamma-glutamylputrescine oxidase
MVSEAVSYWQDTSPMFPLSTHLPPTADVVVIGGGLLGTATSYWLARSGARVVQLERTTLASGATGRNGGFVRAGTAGPYRDAIANLGYETARAIMDITYTNQILLHQILRDEDINCDYREPGALKLAISEEQVEQHRLEVEVLEKDGFVAQWLDRAQVQELIKTPLGPEIQGGRFLPGQPLVHSARLVKGLARAAVRHGARQYQAEVHKIAREGEHIRLHTSQGNLITPTVVLAVNAWTSKVLPALTNIIVPVLEQMLAYKSITPIFPMGLSVHINAGEYMQQTPSGNILIGGCGFVAPNAGVGVWDSMPTTTVQEAIQQILPRLFPQLMPQLYVLQRWAGLLGCTSDMQPIIDYAPALPQVFFVGGFSGHGMPFGIRFGQLLAEAATTGTLSPALKPFRLDRPTLKKITIP